MVLCGLGMWWTTATRPPIPYDSSEAGSLEAEYHGTVSNQRKSRRDRPFKSTPDTPGQVGRRPSRPSFLVVVAVLWIVAGGLTLLYLHATWKLIPAIVYFGFGALYLRAAVASVIRRQKRLDSAP
ncbi:MAG: hypothetical protein M1350_06495 [Actinobacteria bacterium]|nr:hypothetical protein [Actinomycetota bacterium]